MNDLESIADLPLEERHAIVRGWLETLTTIYEQAAAERDRLRTGVQDLLDGAEQQSQSHIDVMAKCRALLGDAR